MNNEYRLVDLYYSLDIYPTMRIVANKLKQHIDYYLIQDRFEYMDLIDLLGGIEVKLDKEFAKEYNLKADVQRLDGFYAWEYIRFMDWKNLKMTVTKDRQKDLIRNDNFQIEANNLQYIYEVRNQRQRYVLQGMRKSFVNLTPDQQMDVVQNFDKVFRTDMDLKFLMNLYKDLLSTKEFSFGSLPGYYVHDKNNLYYYPDLPNFEMLRQQEIRQNLEKQRRKGQTVY
jgi:anionic cell wall polymer biosynthesis LytR-Cps2A-Psr (LCP) family protein